MGAPNMNMITNSERDDVQTRAKGAGRRGAAVVIWILPFGAA